MMKSYLEIQVPIRYDAKWFQKLRTVCRHIPVKWQLGYYHITMAFLDETPEGMDLQPVLDRHLATLSAPAIAFDKLDAFTSTSGMCIIHLTATVIPQDFLETIEAIRADLKATGCRIESDFRLHVTLGRVKDVNISLSDIQESISSVDLPAFSLCLSDVDYREFRGKLLYETILKRQ